MRAQLAEQTLTRVVGDRDDLERTSGEQQRRAVGRKLVAGRLRDYDISSGPPHGGLQLSAFGDRIDDGQVRLQSDDLGDDVDQHRWHVGKDDSDLLHRFHARWSQCDGLCRGGEWTGRSGNDPAGDVDRTAERKEDRSVASDMAQRRKSGAKRHWPGRIVGLRIDLDRRGRKIEGAARSVALLEMMPKSGHRSSEEIMLAPTR